MTPVKPPDQLTAIYCLLRSLGLNACQVGFFYTARAVQLAVREPERLSLVTKLLYPDVGRQCGVSAQAVERGIRAAAQTAWAAEPAEVQSLSPAPLDRKPRPSLFIALLAAQFSPSEE